MRDPRRNFSAWLRSWIGLASIAGLIGASTFVLLLCPCDRPAGSFYSVFLASLSGFFALSAAGVLYARLRKDKAATAFISAFEAVAMVAIAAIFFFSVDQVIGVAVRMLFGAGGA